MLNLEDYILVQESVDALCESEQTQFTDEQIDKAEYFDLKWNPTSYKTALHIYDANGEPLGSVEFEDADVAIEYVTEVFDLDEEDVRDLDSYAWANDGNTDLRAYDVSDEVGVN